MLHTAHSCSQSLLLCTQLRLHTGSSSHCVNKQLIKASPWITLKRTTRTPSDSERPFTWTLHTSITCTARVYPTHGSPISPFTDSLACVITPLSPEPQRERHRVRCVKEGHAWLRKHLPQELEDKRLSKVETLPCFYFEDKFYVTVHGPTSSFTSHHMFMPTSEAAFGKGGILCRGFRKTGRHIAVLTLE